MTRRSSRPRSVLFAAQKGAALMIMMLIMVLGTSWAVVSAVTQASRNTLDEQKKTADSLRLAKTALLGFAAQDALTSDVPGMFPCPEATNSIGTGNEGTRNAACASLPAIGRLPWKTLGIDKPLDGAGEALWYVVGASVRTAPINYSTMGTLTLDGTANAAVAFIIAPGAALNTVSASGTAPSPCVKRNQSTGRNASPLNYNDFIECGNATLAAFTSFRNDTWGNDRVISITAAEMLSAIEGSVADRMQRNVAPALNGSPSLATSWYQTDSLSEWGAKFFPYASAWGNPTTNDSCGNYGVTEGLLPLATGDVAVGSTCSSRWTSGTVTKLSGSGSFSFTSCVANPAANPTRMRCTFSYSGSPVLLATVTAPNIAMGFRTAPTSAQVTFTPTSGNTITLRTPSIVAASGNGQLALRVTMANKASSGTGRINVPYPSDSILLSTDTGSNPDLAWFINNQWNRYTYYAISPAAAANPSGICTSANVTNCLTLNNAETGTGNVNDKRLALILSGRPLAGKTQPSASLNAYFEVQNDQSATFGDRTFQRGAISTTFNDRPAVCPFQRQSTGTANVLCN
jgi:hypothetical protein